MNPKEKAFSLFCKYYRDSDLLVEDLSRIQAKECSLIAVDEIMDYLNKVMIPNPFVQYWNEVKKEIENL